MHAMSLILQLFDCHVMRARHGYLMCAMRSACAHAGFHMTAAVASVPTLGLPYAVSLLGWPGGIIALIAGGCVTMFTAFLISGLLEYGGTRHLRYRNLSQAIFGGLPFVPSLPLILHLLTRIYGIDDLRAAIVGYPLRQRADLHAHHTCFLTHARRPAWPSVSDELVMVLAAAQP